MAPRQEPRQQERGGGQIQTNLRSLWCPQRPSEAPDLRSLRGGGSQIRPVSAAAALLLLLLSRLSPPPKPPRLLLPLQPPRRRRHLRRVLRRGRRRLLAPRRLLPNLQRRPRVQRRRPEEGCPGRERAPLQLGGPLQGRQKEDEDLQERLRRFWVKQSYL